MLSRPSILLFSIFFFSCNSTRENNTATYVNAQSQVKNDSSEYYARIKAERDSIEMCMILARAAQRDNSPLDILVEPYSFCIIKYEIRYQASTFQNSLPEEVVSISDIEQLPSYNEDVKYRFMDKIENKIKKSHPGSEIRIIEREVKNFNTYSAASKELEKLHKMYPVNQQLF
ncbi:hypothetical protein [Chitinophaga sp.]|uniref:hypothetical protein n=1 Tax=Chitinophaga sp. TaxID=1869181 RepID=UPI002F92F130